MSLVLLRKVSTPATAPATGFNVLWAQYDTQSRIEVQDVSTSATNVDFELAIDALVPGASFCVGTTRREVRYAGQGRVYTLDVPDSPACAFSPATFAAVPTGVIFLTGNEGQITAFWSMPGGPYTVSCALMEPGIDNSGETFYQEFSTGQITATFGVTSSFAPVLGTSRGSDGISVGRYRVRVVSQVTGQTLDTEVIVPPFLPYTFTFPSGQDAPDPSRGRILLYNVLPSFGVFRRGAYTSGPLTVHIGELVRVEGNNPSDQRLYFRLGQILVSTDPDYTLLSLTALATDDNTGVISATFYHNGVVSSNSVTFTGASYWEESAAFTQHLPYTRYCLPAGTVLFQNPLPALPDTLCDGTGGIYQRAKSQARPIEAANLIYFQPSKPGEATGGIIVEVSEATVANGPALTYELLTTTGAVLATNGTGRFGELVAGSYRMRVTAPTAAYLLPLLFDFSLTAAYGLHYYTDFSDVGNSQPCRLELWTRGYQDEPKKLLGQADMVEIEQQGLESGALQSDLGYSVGSSLSMRLFTEPGELEDLVLDDRRCRVDFYYMGELNFSGYVEAGIYNEPLLAGPVRVELLAADGLAELRNTDFAGDHGQELRGRWPAINTLLHCLSRTTISLPLLNVTNRRALEMTTAEVMETAAFTERLAYLEENGQSLDCRTVVDAICQAFGGTLFQRQGSWQVRSLLEAVADAPARFYTAAGTPDPTTPQLLISAPAATLKPARLAVAGDWFWTGVSQARQRRPGWKSLTAAGNVGYTNNLFRAGDAFSLPLAWDASGTTLLPTTGWRAGSAYGGASNLFGLKLVQVEGSEAVATQWAQPNGGFNYLESEPLALAAGREGIPMVLSVTAKFQSLLLGIKALTQAFTELFVEIVADDAAGLPVSFGHTLRFELQTDASSGYTTVSRRLPVGLPAGLTRPRVRLHAVKFTKFQLPGFNPTFATLLVQAVQLQPLPQGVAWESETSFTAIGPGGTTRPTEPVTVFHSDSPEAAGIFSGNTGAFRRVVSRGLIGPTTQWARASDLLPAPLLASAALDILALRANPSRVLTGTVQHRAGSRPSQPQFLDAVDCPYDIDGRRWAVVGRRWNVKQSQTEVTLLEIGSGQYLTAPVYAFPDNAILQETGVQQLNDYLFPIYITNEDGIPVIEE